MIGQWHHHDQLNELAARKTPMVVWGAQLPQQLYCTVGGDNIAGGELATEHLVESGRRRIAFFGDIDLPEVGQRFEGHQRVLTRRGMAITPDLLQRTPFIEGAARGAVAHLLDNKVAFDAVFASSDLLALETISALRARGLKLPQDVAVVGYDDIGIARYSHPSLTTIRQSVTKAGEGIVDALLKIADGKRAKPQILPTELIIRESSG
jgi:DNA-binding LacI/PurR family transcriptional regulator